MTTPAQTRRLDAIRALTDKYLTPYGVLKPNATVGRILGDIHVLRCLGRTERWAVALDRWETLVGQNPRNLDWALIQGSVFAAYGAL